MMGNLREKTEEEMSSGSETQTSSTCFKETKVPIFKFVHFSLKCAKYNRFLYKQR